MYPHLIFIEYARTSCIHLPYTKICQSTLMLAIEKGDPFHNSKISVFLFFLIYHIFSGDSLLNTSVLCLK